MGKYYLAPTVAADAEDKAVSRGAGAFMVVRRSAPTYVFLGTLAHYSMLSVLPGMPWRPAALALLVAHLGEGGWWCCCRRHPMDAAALRDAPSASPDRAGPSLGILSALESELGSRFPLTSPWNAIASLYNAALGREVRVRRRACAKALRHRPAALPAPRPRSQSLGAACMAWLAVQAIVGAPLIEAVLTAWPGLVSADVARPAFCALGLAAGLAVIVLDCNL